jgi:hypothetical protein
VTGRILFVVAVVGAGWLGATQVSAQSTPRGYGTELAAATPAPQAVPFNGKQESVQAEFLFLATDGYRKNVSLMVSGTTAPVLTLPVTEDLRIFIGGRKAVWSQLRPGARLTLRMDPTNREIQEMRVMGQERHVAIQREVGVVREIPPPSIGEVLRALPKKKRGVPGIYELSCDDVDIATERLVDHVDPPRFFPLVGPARLHHCHWRCVVHYTEIVTSMYPVPFESRRPRVEVVYIDTNSLIPIKK